jgi:hypothetical protein
VTIYYNDLIKHVLISSKYLLLELELKGAHVQMNT